jgi:hypothetical protein
MPTVPRRLRAAAWTLTIAPAAILLYYIVSTGVNGLVWDHLSSAEIFDRWDSGRFTVEYLFRQHNEHRKAVPRLVTLVLGRLTGFDTRAELLLQWALLCATCALLYRAFRRETRLTLLAFAPILWLALSLRPYEILLVGDGLLTYLSMIFFIGALYALGLSGAPSWREFSAAVACGLLATYSQANGLLVWPIGLVILLAGLRGLERRRQDLQQAGAWMLAGAVTTAAYFHGYLDPGNHPPARFVLDHPLLAAKYFLCLAGGSLSPEQNSAVAAGLVLTAVELFAAAAIVYAWWRDRAQPPFGFWILALGVATTLTIVPNRAGLGLGQALSPRYAAYSCFGPIGAYWCLLALRRRVHGAHLLAPAVAMLLVVGYLAGSLDAWGRRGAWYAEKHWRAYLLYAAKYQPPSVLENLYSDTGQARAFAAQLERLHLNVFAESHADPAGLAPGGGTPQFAIQAVNGAPFEHDRTIEIGPDAAVSIDGWALDPSGSRGVAAVFATVDGTLDLPGGVGMLRLDAAALPPALRWTGFSISFGGFVLGPGEHAVALKIVSADGQHAALTPTLFRVRRR